MLRLVSADDFNYAELLRKALGEVAPTPTSVFDGVDRVDDDRRSRHQRRLRHRVRNDIGGETGRLIASNARPPQRRLDGIDTEIGRPEARRQRLSQSSLADT